MKTCYMCDNRATSKEHVPPAMFFPEQKDLPKGWDYKKQLITVPSCDLHNSKKSEDDQFICIIIASHFEGNLSAQRHFSTKVMRALRKHRSLLTYFKNPRPALVEGRSTGMFDVDMDRFKGAFDHITRGLYFNKYKKKWTEQITIFSPSLLPGSNDQLDQYHLIQGVTRMGNQVFADFPKLGSNPEIFYYQIHCDEQLKRLWIKMVFYEGFVVIAYSSPTIDFPPSS